MRGWNKRVVVQELLFGVWRGWVVISKHIRKYTNEKKKKKKKREEKKLISSAITYYKPGIYLTYFYIFFFYILKTINLEKDEE